ncbi:MAG: metallopeptidase [Verrucomicrobia bacterium]|nr:metallopeptidase [Verrucomicrobiota bacterium]
MAVIRSSACFITMLCLVPWLAAAEAPKPASHTVRELEGWRVRVDDRLLAGPDAALGKRAIDSLERRLADIRAVVPQPALGKLQGFGIVLDLSHGALNNLQYHPSAGWLTAHGYAADLARCVHIPVAAQLLEPRQINVQPWCVLHELAHAYHDQILGFEEPRILAAYRAFKESGRGDKALLITGERVRHYGLTDQKEFFSEMTEAYFGTNDFFPFNRGELMTAEPDVHRLIGGLWGISDKGR